LPRVEAFDFCVGATSAVVARIDDYVSVGKALDPLACCAVDELNVDADLAV
jgi:hypothetical protein